MSNINGDLLDDGLQAVMGKERCQDVTEQMKKNPKCGFKLSRENGPSLGFPAGIGRDLCRMHLNREWRNV